MLKYERSPVDCPGPCNGVPSDRIAVRIVGELQAYQRRNGFLDHLGRRFCHRRLVVALYSDPVCSGRQVVVGK